MIGIGVDLFCSKAAALPEWGRGSGGHMDDVLKRLGAVEFAIGEMRSDLRHLATKAELQEAIGAVRADMHAMETRLVGSIGAIESRLVGTIGAMDTRLSAAMSSIDGRIIKWMLGSLISSVAAAAGVAKVVHDFLS